ncbi:CASP-like protein 1E1 [Andrographis paniculata]|uniref:CASP-like protein 1E1 n=1 Tax=Andrographis paniculata TaxID=175694 RepID=UPI0021E82FC3|nr:CASP-like protein 1E1 [Andrographis paniculata]
MITACDFVFRVLAVLLCVAAAVVIGVDRETTEVDIAVVPGFPGFSFPFSAKWHYLSALFYFLVANALASGYAIISAIVVLINRGRNKGVVAAVVVFDVAVVAILFSSLGATVAVGLIAYQGVERLGWEEVCTVYNRFCHQGGAAVGLSSAACVAFVIVALVGVFTLQRTAGAGAGAG